MIRKTWNDWRINQDDVRTRDVFTVGDEGSTAALVHAGTCSRIRGDVPGRLAVQMIRWAIAASVPFQWVAADSVCGVGEV